MSDRSSADSFRSSGQKKKLRFGNSPNKPCPGEKNKSPALRSFYCRWHWKARSMEKKREHLRIPTTHQVTCCILKLHCQVYHLRQTATVRRWTAWAKIRVLRMNFGLDSFGIRLLPINHTPENKKNDGFEWYILRFLTCQSNAFIKTLRRKNHWAQPHICRSHLLTSNGTLAIDLARLTIQLCKASWCQAMNAIRNSPKTMRANLMTKTEREATTWDVNQMNNQSDASKHWKRYSTWIKHEMRCAETPHPFWPEESFLRVQLSTNQFDTVDLLSKLNCSLWKKTCCQEVQNYASLASKLFVSYSIYWYLNSSETTFNMFHTLYWNTYSRTLL